MSIYFNQTNLTAGDSFSGGSGGSNFPNGITISDYNIVPEQTFAWGQPSLVVSQPNAPPLNQATFQADNLLAFTGTGGTDDKSCLINSSTIRFRGNLGTGVGSDLVTAIDANLGTSNAFDIKNVNSISGTKYTTGVNPSWNPINFTLRPDQVTDKGLIYMTIGWDAVDTGANPTLVAGADASGAFIRSFWPGYITMPLYLGGQDVIVESDNETFLFGEGKAGAIGTLSTGVQFLSSRNNFSSIQDNTNTYNANMTALLSSLKSVYPACFS